jgi:hypothetical protein
MAEKLLNTNPWLKIWTEPRKTIKAIVNFNPKYRFAFLSGVYGLPMLLDAAQNSSLGQSLPLAAIVVISLVLSVFIGMLAFTVMSGLLFWTGRWLGGNAPYLHIRAALSWANVPNVIRIVLWAVLIGVFGNRVFSNTFVETPLLGYELAVRGFIFLALMVLAIWSFIILLNTLAQVQGFSAWRALLNVIIPFVIVTLFIWFVLWVVWWFIGVPQQV